VARRHNYPAEAFSDQTEANAVAPTWYRDPHGFADRAATVRRRHFWYFRMARRLAPEITLWGWADTDGARLLQEPVDPPPEASEAPLKLTPIDQEMPPELPGRRIHPPLTPE
jgi:hypothetical protein